MAVFRVAPLTESTMENAWKFPFNLFVKEASAESNFDDVYIYIDELPTQQR